MSSTAVATESRRTWITLGAAARTLGVSVPTVRLLIRDGKLTSRQVGYWLRVDRAEVDRLDRESIQPATCNA